MKTAKLILVEKLSSQMTKTTVCILPENELARISCVGFIIFYYISPSLFIQRTNSTNVNSDEHLFRSALHTYDIVLF